jgi:hypothetical protein
MPNLFINQLQVGSLVSSTVFREREKLSCANDSERKQALILKSIFQEINPLQIQIFKTQNLCAVVKNVLIQFYSCEAQELSIAIFLCKLYKIREIF